MLTLFAAVATYLGFCAIFVAAASSDRKVGRWIGFGILTLAVPVSFYLGGAVTNFSDGQCYSGAFRAIANSVEATQAPKELAKSIRELPLNGYETECHEVEAAALALPNSHAP